MNAPGPGNTASEAARRLHFGSLVVDGLSTSPITREQYARFRGGGVAAANLTAASIDHDLPDALVDIERVVSAVRALPDCYLLVTRIGDIDAARASDRIGIILGLQNGRPLQERLEHVWTLHELGVRVVQLTYNERNRLGDGCTEPEDAGLTSLGRQTIGAMNRQGILIDLSHCGHRTTRDAIDASEHPVAITHANPWGLVHNPRNKPDDVLRALASRGGVIGICPWSPMNAVPGEGRPTLQNLVAAVDYTTDLIGVEHVGIGTDHSANSATREEWETMFGRPGRYPTVTGHLGDWFGFDTRFVNGLQSTDRLPLFTDALLNRGYSGTDVQMILGGNFLRLLSAVWR